MKGVKKIEKNSLLLLNYVFLCKNLNNIICGPQRTVQNKKIKAVHDPFKIYG